MCLCVGFVKCGCVYMLVLQSVFVCWFCKLWVCECVAFVKCGCVYVLILFVGVCIC